jgi:hypothetical protein
MTNLNDAVYLTIGIPTVLYVLQSVQFCVQQHRYGMALTFLAYGIANCGLMLDAKGI